MDQRQCLKHRKMMMGQTFAAYLESEDSIDRTSHHVRTVVTRSGEIFRSSAESLPVLGYLPHELKGLSIFKLMDYADARKVRLALTRMTRPTASTLPVRLRLRTKKGAFCVLSGSIEAREADYVITSSFLFEEPARPEDRERARFFRRVRTALTAPRQIRVGDIFARRTVVVRRKFALAA